MLLLLGVVVAVLTMVTVLVLAVIVPMLQAKTLAVGQALSLP
jgi:hypothetical protein